MNKYKVLSLALLFALAGTHSLQAATESKDLQNSSSATDTAPSYEKSEEGSLAGEAGQEFSDGAKGLGRGFVKGAQVTGNAFKKAGTTMGRGFKRAGLAIRNYFAGKPELEERDLGSEAYQPEQQYQYEAAPLSPGTASRDLDAVGNAPSSGGDSAFN